MSKTKLAIIGAITAVLIVTGAYAYVRANDESGSEKSKLMEQMVEKGIISQEQAEQIKNYAQEFRKERQQEMMENHLNKAVENGDITEDEANQIRDWLNNRPEAMSKLKPLMKHGKRAIHSSGFMK